VACLVLSIVGWNLIRLITSIGWRQPLEAYAHRPGSIYIGVTGATWALTGMVISWGILRGQSWSVRGLRIAAVAYSAWTWIDRLLLQPRGAANWIFAAALTVLLLAFTLATTLESRVHTYFGREAP
jgi:hypothetical protein